MIVRLHRVIVDPVIRALCCHSYPGHPRGCPNYNHKPGCPPGAPMFDDRMDLDQEIYAIINEFDLGAHIERMRQNNPAWSERQLSCCLYWQPKARKQHSAMIKAFLHDHPGFVADTCPEAGGVNVTETLRLAGVELEWPPKKISRQVAIAARPRLDMTARLEGLFHAQGRG